MRRRRYRLFALTCMTCALFGSPPTSAQISRRLDRCLAYPTVADDIDDRREEVRAKVAATEGVPAPARTVVMDEAKLDGLAHLPDATRKRPLAGLKQGTFKPDSAWRGDVRDVSIRGAWADEGFFKVQPTVRAQVVSTEEAVQHILLTVHDNEGLQYRLGDAGIRSSNPDNPLIFSSDDLRKLIHLQEADIPSARKARAAIEAITEFYRRDRTIDSVLAPILDMDDQNQRSSRLMEIAKEKQYRWGEGRGFWS
jgi:hypothetical protein